MTYRSGRRGSRRASDAGHLRPVYDAERPELFFKSAAWRVAGPAGRSAIRADSDVDVPEPELALVVNAFGEIVGYTVCNDVSSRSIEGENPLYLPQAKVYPGSCALGRASAGLGGGRSVRAAHADAILRDGERAWRVRAGTSGLNGGSTTWFAYLFREDDFPDGVVLSTGTGAGPRAAVHTAGRRRRRDRDRLIGVLPPHR